MNEYSWLWPAVLCGLIALVGNVVLGHQVLKRQVIFIDLAVAQVAALGAAVSQYWFINVPWLHESVFGEMLGPWILSLGFCGVIALLEDKIRHLLEPLIGCLFAVSASLAVIVVSKDPHGAEFIQRILNGQLLWATWDDVALIGGVTVVMLTLIAMKPQLMSGRAFYAVFAILMPVTVKLTGVYLEFALLVVPTLFTVMLAPKTALIASLVIGVVGILSGIVVSTLWDLPSGAAMVITLFISGLVFFPFLQFFFRPQYRQTSEA
ncbi:metal ABC transporter permease [Thaumasiovibrio subtropicus]|uniref:metal ABC transporter permease n=1 Tax=Thaumasiovibrio subtropicus TaxID=1891207 RepID=UPI000B362379|nr:metal ABC transporter permease [Thaumasiovibrio subtropicus]